VAWKLCVFKSMFLKTHSDQATGQVATEKDTYMGSGVHFYIKYMASGERLSALNTVPVPSGLALWLGSYAFSNVSEDA
jgi:hypothetical protein